ncbi:unnamed protein product [Agarophyton chilense]|eukprot:gb/GEZJ01000403.1/.p3 GENE.gb/GEZJ01000403.1/~~gb/GEZJ01000403.1/.p3  ORF type:complete len:342 (-),score=66.42 gb/GEZJ01000403.1/:4272-5297(-)
MSALKFLGKKSWHTGNIKNNEKVWLKEQEEAKEKSRIEELRKQIEEERKLKEAEDLEVKSGRLDPEQLLKRRRINWMYEFEPSRNHDSEKVVNDKEREEILTGKKDVTLETLENEKEKAGPSMIDLENKMREDPLLDIKRQRMQAAKVQHLRKLYGVQDPHSSDTTQKMKRKQYRQAVREERRRRREARQPLRSEMSAYGRSYKDAEDVPHPLKTKTTETLQRNSVPFEEKRGEYGLRIPEGSRTAFAKKTHTPCRGRFDQRPPQPPIPSRSRRRFDQPPGFAASQEKKTTNLNRKDKERILEQMRQDAEEIEIQRKIRTGTFESDCKAGGFDSRKRKFSE